MRSDDAADNSPDSSATALRVFVADQIVIHEEHVMDSVGPKDIGLAADLFRVFGRWTGDFVSVFGRLVGTGCSGLRCDGIHETTLAKTTTLFGGVERHVRAEAGEMLATIGFVMYTARDTRIFRSPTRYTKTNINTTIWRLVREANGAWKITFKKQRSAPRRSG
jgi:hypothetical protein